MLLAGVLAAVRLCFVVLSISVSNIQKKVVSRYRIETRFGVTPQSIGFA
jgi:hypothetical protein